ncbi:MAG: Hsp20/alpha crystallin family protein [Alphaproteobacteria bacterium]
MAETNQPKQQRGSSALTPFGSLQDDMQRMFQDFFGDLTFPSMRSLAGAATIKAPRMDVAETDAAFVITAELPGVEEKDIEVKVSDGVVTVRGEKKAEKEEKDKNYHRIERSYGMFERSLTLPPNVDAEKISADLSKGVLTVTMPKAAQKSPPVKKIAVKSRS